MYRRLLVASLVLAGFALADAASTSAKVNLNIIIGGGGGYNRKIVCWEGREIVKQWFYNVTYLNCSGKYFRYRGKADGRWYSIKVNSYTARIVDVDRY